jgi:MFS superfamily sulfate permease-like transporter
MPHTREFTFHYFKQDLRAGITVFFVALPLCLAISLASNAPVYSGLIAGIVGGILVTMLSGSHISVSGPAAGLTAICAAAITELGGLELFFLAVAVAGFIQVLLGVFRLGGFTHFIPSAVIKGMLAAIGVMLILKQIPFLIGYDRPDFLTRDLFNIFSLDHGFANVKNIYHHSSAGTIIISMFCLLLLIVWKKTVAKKISFVPTSFIVVLFGALLAWLFTRYIPQFSLMPGQFVHVPRNMFSDISLPDPSRIFSNSDIWKNAVVICLVASLETLLSVEAVDKLDPYNRITPQNRELVAQGAGNLCSGLLAGIPITAVIVRSSANAEAGARTKLSSLVHGVLLLVLIYFAAELLNLIPYCVLAVILIRTGYNLAKPAMIRSVYRLGREQFMPFIVTLVAILFSDLLIGVAIGVAYSAYFIFRNTYKAGFSVDREDVDGKNRYHLQLAMNVSYINKKKLKDELEKIPERSMVHIDGSNSIYIDHDVLEVINEFKSKARHKEIELELTAIPEVTTLEMH